MQMRLVPIQKQFQKQILTPVMQQAIQILLLPIMEMDQLIEQELETNPLLEMDEEAAAAESLPLYLKERMESIYEKSEREFGEPEEEFSEERPIQDLPSLEDELMRQMRVEFSDPLECMIGEFILGNLNEDGYLTTNSVEISQNLQIDISLVERVLSVIQTFEPAGIAAQNLRECLLIQLKIKFKTPPFLAAKIIQNHLAELGQKNYAALARALKVSLEDVKQAVKTIASLDPRPARNYRPLKSHTYIKPDVFVVHDEKIGYQVLINGEGVPPVRINTSYWKMLRQKLLSVEDKAYIRKKMRDAINFVRGIQQRGDTLEKISQYILEHQKDFFENGISSLTPMSLKDVAQRLERNESTISRAIHNKYIDTPQGLLPMKFFFSQGVLPRAQTQDEINAGAVPSNGEAVSNRSIKEEIRELVESENKSSPLSDQELVELLDKKGIKIARRTISKYRQMLDIMPSHLRKE
ncbi:MAG: RNA polymerase factor sigma-54 [Candidatus Omnitrophica bacterium]|nr:RNA polymerase factor sigma-54 [Candidatus Omnitrophota bacterium]